MHRAQAGSSLQVPRRPGCPLTDTRAGHRIAERRVNARLVGLVARLDALAGDLERRIADAAGELSALLAPMER
ncbi:DUF2236 domain-containing protein, partial [Streptomyces murinus]